MTARVTWSMPPEIIERAEGRWERVEKAEATAVLAAEIRIESDLKTNLLSGQTIHRRSGNLSRAVFHDPTSISAMPPLRGFVGIGEEAPYAAGLNDGNPPHVIEAPEGRMLRFESGGEVFFRRRVNHPGNQPFRFMELALERGTEPFISDIKARVTKALTE